MFLQNCHTTFLCNCNDCVVMCAIVALLEKKFYRNRRIILRLSNLLYLYRPYQYIFIIIYIYFLNIIQQKFINSSIHFLHYGSTCFYYLLIDNFK
jgi:hypothetical protein